MKHSRPTNLKLFPALVDEDVNHLHAGDHCKSWQTLLQTEAQWRQLGACLMYMLAEHHCLLQQSNCSSRPSDSPLALSRGSAYGTGAQYCGAALALRTARPVCSC